MHGSVISIKRAGTVPRRWPPGNVASACSRRTRNCRANSRRRDPDLLLPSRTTLLHTLPESNAGGNLNTNHNMQKQAPANPAAIDPRREEAIFDAALGLPAEQRAAYLEKVCGDEPELRERVK